MYKMRSRSLQRSTSVRTDRHDSKFNERRVSTAIRSLRTHYKTVMLLASDPSLITAYGPLQAHHYRDLRKQYLDDLLLIVRKRKSFDGYPGDWEADKARLVNALALATLQHTGNSVRPELHRGVATEIERWVRRR